MDLKERKEKKNSSLSAFIIAGIFLVLGLAFIPLTIIEGEFVHNSVEAVFMFILFIVSFLFLVYAIIRLVQYLKKDK